MWNYFPFSVLKYYESFHYIRCWTLSKMLYCLLKFAEKSLALMGRWEIPKLCTVLIVKISGQPDVSEIV